jgi:hypothetical protein
MGTVLTLIYAALTFLSVSGLLPALAPYRLQLVLGVLAAIGSAPALMLAGRRVLNLPFWLMVGFTGVVLASWWPHGWLGGVKRGLFNFLPAGILYFLAAVNFRSVRRLRALRLTLAAITLYMLGRGVWEYHAWSGETPYVMLQRLEEGQQELRRLRGLGVLGDPNDYAQYLVTLLPLLFVVRPGVNRWIKRLGAGLAALAFLYGLYLTRSRGGLVGLAGLVGLVLRERYKWLGAAVAAGVVVAALLALGFTGGREVTLGAGIDRLNLWSEGLGMIKSSPVWGVGFGAYWDHAEKAAHNSFLHCAAELGMAGYFFWMGLVVVSLWRLGQVIAGGGGEGADPELRSWARAVRLGLYGFLLTGIFLSRTYEPLPYLLLGTAGAIANIEAERRGTPVVPPWKGWVVWTLGLCVGSILLIYVLVRLRSL